MTVNRMILAALAAILFFGSALKSDPAESMNLMWNIDQILALSKVNATATLREQGRHASQQCCKICHQGKACGDTCISRQDTCRVGQGCACDG
jgi:hypothetical protein